jgi:hypothetical protein
LPKDPSGDYGGDEGWARLALEVPGGFAGIYLDDDGRPVLLLTHPEKKEDAIAALSTRQFVGLPDGTSLRDAIVKRAKWDFAQLYDWAHSRKLRISVQVLTSDIDEVHNRLDYGVLQRDVATAKADFKKLSLPAGLVNVHAQTPVILDSR